MSEGYIGEVRLFAGTYAPVGWADCDGSLLNISEHNALYALIGTTYGGDAQTTFALPDLRGRVPLHLGQGAGLSSHTLGEAGGSETVTLTGQQVPPHIHTATAATTGQVVSPAGAILASAQSRQAGVRTYSTNTAVTTQLSPASVAPAGGAQPHSNMQPSVAIRYIIALEGIYPASN